jgi:uncharacterized protein involved in outer membrane biogenesis
VRKTLIGLLVVFLVFGGVLASAVLLIDGERLRNAVVDYMERRGGVQLEIERVERTVGLFPRIEVHNLNLRQPEFTDSPLLEIEYAAFDLDLLSLLFEPVTLRNVVLESPTVVLPVADEGLLYWGPVLADLIERLRRFDWALHGFRIDGLEVEASHTVRDARVLLTAASIEGAMPHVADLTLRMRDINGDLRSALPLPINGSLVIDEATLRHADQDLPVTLEADGHIGSRPLTLRVRSGNVLKGDPNLRDAIDATLELGTSTLRVNGTASRGAEPHFDLGFEIGIEAWAPMPDSDVRFRLSDDGLAWNASDINAVVGDAMASGELRVERRDPRPLLTGAVQLAGFAFGSSRNSGASDADPHASPSDRAANRDASVGPSDNERSTSSEIFRLALARLDRLDARLDVQAEALKLFGVPIAHLRGQGQLADGRLQLAPVDAEVLGGAAGASLSLASHGELPRFELTTSFGGVETSELAAALGMDHEVFGELQGSFELSSAALEQITDGAAGSATLLMSGGQLSAALAQLVDMDFAERILGAFKTKKETTPIRCAIADFEGHDGIFESQALVVDTGEVKLVGAGTINLAERTIDLVIRPYEKDFSLFSSDAPLRVSGPLSKPDVSPDKGALAVSLLTPIEIGRAENADCQALIQWASDAMTDSARRTAARRNRR